MNKKISIIIPCYNLGDYVLPMIESIKKQLVFLDFQPIIINDCSTDNTLELIKENIDDRFILLENKENVKLSETRNIGAKMASGDYLFFLDGDDLLSDDFHSSVAKIDDDKVIRFENRGRRFKDGFISLNKFFELSVQTSSYIIERKFFFDNKLSFEPGLLYEDNHFMLRLENVLLENNFSKIRFINSELRIYTVDRDGSIMETRQSFSDLKKSFEGMINIKGPRYDRYIFQLWYTFLNSFKMTTRLTINEGDKENLFEYLKKMKKEFRFWKLPVLYKIRYILYLIFRRATV